ncbi:MAG: hypothetical protein HOO06_08305 [Bdellovibrionaceae bacterium]|jgi:hypothetical protein|nr:hypothetical protein [Pseudobdellovibrionaceae bacterium]
MNKVLLLFLVLISLPLSAVSTVENGKYRLSTKAYKTIHCKTYYFDYILKSNETETEVELRNIRLMLKEDIDGFESTLMPYKEERGRDMTIYSIKVKTEANSCDFHTSEPYVASCYNISQVNVSIQETKDSKPRTIQVSSFQFNFTKVQAVYFNTIGDSINVDFSLDLGDGQSNSPKKLIYVNRVKLGENGRVLGQSCNGTL